MILVTAEEMRRLDEETIKGLGVPGVVLMESAGRGVVEVIAGLPEVAARGGVEGLRVVVVAGPGNNGGDGFVVARHLHHRGAAVRLILGAPPERVQGDARIHFVAAQRSGVAMVDSTVDREAVAAALGSAEVVVDALLGTGVARPVSGAFAALIEAINQSPGLRVAVDLPSGLDADRGHPLGLCVAAHHTVTFALPKLGLCTAPGFVHAGELHVVDIGIPRCLAASIQRRLLDERCLDPLRAPRPPEGHKGSFGHVLVVAGSSTHTGAALLAGQAAARAGAGLVTIASPERAQAALAGRVLEVMTAPLGPEPLDGAVAWGHLAPLLDGKRAVAFGPGLGRGPGLRGLLERLLAHWEGPLVLDADGLNLLAEDLAPLGPSRAQVVLTPHPAEMARLLGSSTAAVQADRVAAAEGLARRSGAVVVLKGARTVIAAPDGRTAINPTGGPWLGSGGSGDVLTGMVATLLAGSLEGFAAATAAVFWHGRAGDLLRREIGEVGVLAGDLVGALPRARR